MKTLLQLVILALAISANALTPFYFSSLNSDGTPQTNQVLMQAYPPTANGFTVYGTNIVYGSGVITNNPSATGFFSNSVAPNQYKFTITALGVSFFAVIPDTTNYQPLSMYLTNAPVVSVPFAGFVVSSYSSVSNALKFVAATNGGAVSYSQLPYTPATNSFSGIVSALTYTPATNNPATNTVVYVSNVAGITNDSGYITNLTITLATNVLYYHQR